MIQINQACFDKVKQLFFDKIIEHYEVVSSDEVKTKEFTKNDATYHVITYRPETAKIQADIIKKTGYPLLPDSPGRVDQTKWISLVFNHTYPSIHISVGERYYKYYPNLDKWKHTFKYKRTLSKHQTEKYYERFVITTRGIMHPCNKYAIINHLMLGTDLCFLDITSDLFYLFYPKLTKWDTTKLVGWSVNTLNKYSSYEDFVLGEYPKIGETMLKLNISEKLLVDLKRCCSVHVIRMLLKHVNNDVALRGEISSISNTNELLSILKDDKYAKFTQFIIDRLPGLHWYGPRRLQRRMLYGYNKQTKAATFWNCLALQVKRATIEHIRALYINKADRAVLSKYGKILDNARDLLAAAKRHLFIPQIIGKRALYIETDEVVILYVKREVSYNSCRYTQTYIKATTWQANQIIVKDTLGECVENYLDIKSFKGINSTKEFMNYKIPYTTKVIKILYKFTLLNNLKVVYSHDHLTRHYMLTFPHMGYKYNVNKQQFVPVNYKEKVEELLLADTYASARIHQLIREIKENKLFACKLFY